MNQKEIYDRMHAIGIIPAIVLNDVKDAVPLADAICKGGLPVAEITYRTEAAHDSIKAMREAHPEMLVGAGTVLTKEAVDSAIDAGAQFIVAPGLNPEIVKYVQSKDVLMIPGVSSASEIEQALALGIHTVKFFPAEQLGGIKTIKALCGPYKNVTFLPTGGVNTDNMLAYLNDPKIFGVGGTWMVKADLIKAGKFDEIEKITHEAVMKMLGMRIAHIGLYVPDRETEPVAKEFADLLQGAVRKTPISYFGTDFVEVMPESDSTPLVHLAIGVNSVERAMEYYTARGYTFNEKTTVRNESGEITLIYFNKKIANTTIHLLKNA